VTQSDLAPATWHVARAACAIVAAGLTIDAVFWRTTLHRAVPWSHAASILLGLAGFGLLSGWRGRSDERVGAGVLLLLVAATAATIAVTNDRLAHSTVRWNPFEAERLGALTIALLAPPRVWLGIACILELTVAPLAQWFAWSPAVRARLPPAAPWFVVCYGLFAVMVYAHRLARKLVERRALQAEAETAALERFMGLLLSMRDLANTPLQTIELTVSLLRRRETLEERLLDRLERATRRLVAMSHALEAEVTAVQRGGARR
jgi:hypothetical protein